MKSNKLGKLMRYYEFYADIQLNTKWRTSAAANAFFSIIFIFIPAAVGGVAYLALSYLGFSNLDPYLIGLIAIALNLSYFLGCFFTKRLMKNLRDDK